MGTSGLASHLVRDKILTQADCQTISRDIGSQGAGFAKVLVAFRIFTEEGLASYLSKKTSYQLLDKSGILESSPEAVGTIDAPLMTHLEVIPLRVDNKKLIVAMADPLDHSSLEQLRFFTGYKIVPAIATFSSLYKTLATIIPDFAASETSLEKFVKSYQPKVSTKKRRKGASVKKDAGEDEPVSLLTRKPASTSDAVTDEYDDAFDTNIDTEKSEDEENLVLSDFDDAPMEEQNINFDEPLTNEQDLEDPLTAAEEVVQEEIAIQDQLSAEETDDPAVLAAYGLDSVSEPTVEIEEDPTLSLEELSQEAQKAEEPEDDFMSGMDEVPQQEEGLSFEAPILEETSEDLPMPAEDDIDSFGLTGEDDLLTQAASGSMEESIEHGYEEAVNVLNKNLGQINFIMDSEKLKILIEETCKEADIQTGALILETAEDQSYLVLYQWSDDPSKTLDDDGLQNQDLRDLLSAASTEEWSSCLPLPAAFASWSQDKKEPMIRKVDHPNGSHYIVLEWSSDALHQEELGALAFNFFKKISSKLANSARKKLAV